MVRQARGRRGMHASSRRRKHPQTGGCWEQWRQRDLAARGLV